MNMASFHSLQFVAETQGYRTYQECLNPHHRTQYIIDRLRRSRGVITGEVTKSHSSLDIILQQSDSSATEHKMHFEFL